MAKNNAINIDIVTGGGHTITFPTADTTLVGRDTTDTLTNKKIDPRVQTQASTSTLTFDRASYDTSFLTAQAVALTIANSSNTNVGDVWSISILDNGTARAISFGTDYVGLNGLALPTTTTASKWMEIIFSKKTSTRVMVSYTTEA